MSVVVSARVFQLPIGYRNPVMVELRTSDGTLGYGEAGVAYGLGGTAAAHLIGELAQRFVLGSDPIRSAPTVRTITELSFWGKATGPIITAAISALELALLDLSGKMLNVPSSVLLGGVEQDEVPVYANGWWFGCTTIEEYADAAASCVADGYTALKFYPLAVPDPVSVLRHPIRRHVDREVMEWGLGTVAAVRERVGPDVDIMLDIGGGIAADLAVALCRELEAYDVAFVEEVFDPSVKGALRHLTAKTSLTVAAGERHLTRYAVPGLLDEGVQLLQPDVANCGGMRELRYIAALAEIAGVRVSPHNYGGPLATAAALQVSAALPNLHQLEYFPYFDAEPGYVEIMETGFTQVSGKSAVHLPSGPGLGVAVNAEALADHVVLELAS